MRSVAAPDVRPAEIAAPYEDTGEAIIARRRLPCLCPGGKACGRGVTVDYSTHRGIVVERVACDRCPRIWTRVNH